MRVKVISRLNENSIMVSALTGIKQDIVFHTRETVIKSDDGKTVDAENLAIGNILEATTNGVMTMSLPPQMSPLELIVVDSSEEFTGRVKEVNDGVYLVEWMEQDALVRPQEDLEVSAEVGDLVCVRFNGIMTRSMPPRINASDFSVIKEDPQFEAEVTEVDQGRLLVKGDDSVSNKTISLDYDFFIELKKGDRIRVTYNGKMTRSLPPKVFASEIIIL